MDGWGGREGSFQLFVLVGIKVIKACIIEEFEREKNFFFFIIQIASIIDIYT